jgi:hypothetical protein
MELFMKRLAFTAVFTFAFACAAFAQGTLNWSTLSPAGLTVQINNNLTPFDGGTSSVSGTYMGTELGGYYFALLYNTSFTGSAIASPSVSSLLSSDWIDTGFLAYNATASAGKVVPVAGTGDNAKVPNGTWPGGIGAQGGTTNNIILVGWSSNLGTSWSEVSTRLENWWNNPPDTYVYFGVSSTGYIVPNIAPAIGPMLFGTAATVNGLPINSPNMQLYLIPLEGLPIPEPGTLALFGLGGLTRLLFHRRKSS